MGHKVNPVGIRLGISRDWNSKWFAGRKDFRDYLIADLRVREYLKSKLSQAGISKIQIERPAKTARITIYTARPGVVIGKKGEDIEKLRKAVSDLMGARRTSTSQRSASRNWTRNWWLSRLPNSWSVASCSVAR